MKKTFLTVLLSSGLILSSFASTAVAASTDSKNDELLIQANIEAPASLSEPNVFLEASNERPSHIGPIYGEFSHDGYKKVNIDGKDFLIRTRYIRLNNPIASDIYNHELIETVARGRTVTTSKTTTISSTVTQSWSNSTTVSVSSELKVGVKILEAGIKTSVSNTYTFGETRSTTKTESVTKGETLSFPDNAPSDHNMAYWYIGFTDTEYDVVVDLVPYVETQTKRKIIDYREVYPPVLGPDGRPLERRYQATLEDGTVITEGDSYFLEHIVYENHSTYYVDNSGPLVPDYNLRKVVNGKLYEPVKAVYARTMKY